MDFSPFYLLDFRSLGGVSLVTLEQPLKGVRGVRERQKSTRTEREAGRDEGTDEGKGNTRRISLITLAHFSSCPEKKSNRESAFPHLRKIATKHKKSSQKQASGLGLFPILPEGLPISVTSLRGNKRKTLWRRRVVATHWPSETTSHRFPPSLSKSTQTSTPPKKVSSGSDGNGRRGGGRGKKPRPLVAIPSGK